MPKGWTPLGVKQDGMLAVAICATFSLSMLIAFGIWASYLLYRYRRVPLAERDRDQHRPAQFMRSTNGVLLFSLLFADMLQALGFVLNYAWIVRNALPPITRSVPLCLIQSVLLQVGDIGTALSSLLICVNLFCLVVLNRHLAVATIAGCLSFVWLLAVVLAVIGPIKRRVSRGPPFYGTAGAWCWITRSYEPYRLYVHYLYIFFVAVANLLLYWIIAWRLRQQRKRLNTEVTRKLVSLSRTMLIFPLFYVATIMPLAAYRCASMAGHPWPIEYALVAGSIFSLGGAVDVLIYTYSRNLLGLGVRRPAAAVRAVPERLVPDEADIDSDSSALASHTSTTDPAILTMVRTGEVDKVIPDQSNSAPPTSQSHQAAAITPPLKDSMSECVHTYVVGLPGPTIARRQSV